MKESNPNTSSAPLDETLVPAQRGVRGIGRVTCLRAADRL